jgi:hypothetical protein
LRLPIWSATRYRAGWSSPDVAEDPFSGVTGRSRPWWSPRAAKRPRRALSRMSMTWRDLAVLVDRPGRVRPTAGESHPGSRRRTTCPRAVSAWPSRVDELGREVLHPPVDTDVIHRDSALGQPFLNIAVRQVVAQVPARRRRDRLLWEPESSERRGRVREVTGAVSQGRPFAQCSKAATRSSSRRSPRRPRAPASRSTRALDTGV